MFLFCQKKEKEEMLCILDCAPNVNGTLAYLGKYYK